MFRLFYVRKFLNQVDQQNQVLDYQMNIDCFHQKNRVLVNEPSRLRLVITHQVVMQPGFPIVILVLQPERLVRIRVNPLVPVQTAPGAIFAVPQQIAVHIGHLARDADLVGVDVGEILLFVFGVVEDLG